MELLQFQLGKKSWVVSCKGRSVAEWFRALVL